MCSAPALIPASKPDDRQGKFKSLFPLRCVGGPEAVIDSFSWLRLAILRLKAAQAEQQAAFVRVVHMPVQDEGVNAVEPFDLFIGVAERSGLDNFAVRALWRMKALLAQDDSPRLTLEKQFRPAQIRGQ